MQQQWVAYTAATREFLELASTIPPEQLDVHSPGQWSPRQVVHHVADSEVQSYARLRRLLAEPAGSVIQGYDEAAWAECPALGYTELPVAHSLLVIESVRMATADIIQRLTEHDLDRAGTHSESGSYSVRQWLDIYTRHPSEHAVQLLRIIDARNRGH